MRFSLTVAGAVPEWPIRRHRFPVSLVDANVVRAPELQKIVQPRPILVKRGIISARPNT
jgi:hypothetical protein